MTNAFPLPAEPVRTLQASHGQEGFSEAGQYTEKKNELLNLWTPKKCQREEGVYVQILLLFVPQNVYILMVDLTS